MRDLLTRLLHAVPAIEVWVSDLHAQHAAHSVQASESGITRLRQYFPLSVLGHARVAIVDVIPFPPVGALGLPEFEAMAAMPMAGITFDHMYFLHRDHVHEAIHFHELVHVVQWSALGVAAFLPTYALGFAQHGYEASPLESIAFDLQAKFERGDDLPRLVDFIRRHADQTRSAAEYFYRSMGMPMATQQ